MDVKTACLGVLACRDASGYEIRKEFEDGLFSHFAEGGFGSIYPALRQLEGEGKVVSVTLGDDGRPGKKVYRLTPRGRLALVDAMARQPGEDKYKSDFLFTLLFAEYQSARWIEQVVDTRIAHYIELLQAMETPDAEQAATGGALPAGHAFVHGFGIAVYRAALDYLEHNKHEIVAVALQSEQRLAGNAAE
jgi:DNA-binding PadR family transcriptional regulator